MKATVSPSGLSASGPSIGRPHWLVLGLGLALVGAGFAFASRTLIVYSRGFYIDAAIYVLLQVTGWVILIEWLRIAGPLTLTESQ